MHHPPPEAERGGAVHSASAHMLLASRRGAAAPPCSALQLEPFFFSPTHLFLLLLLLLSGFGSAAARTCVSPGVADGMRRYLTMERIPLPWPRRDSARGESAPLLPKAVSARQDEYPEAGQYDERDDNGPVFRRHLYSYSLMDYLLKYFLFLCNLTFTIVGLAFLGLGMWGLVSKESFAREQIGHIGTDPMLVIVALGLVLTALCLSGCVGALRENCFLLRLFSAAVLTLITLQVVATIVAYSVQDQIGGYVRSGLRAAMARYQDDLDLRFIVDEIQTNLQCCGADNYRDWEINIYYNCSAPGVLACGVPATCCVDPLENGTVWNSQCGVRAQALDEFTAQSVVFLGGCLGAVSRWIERHEGLIGTIGLVALGVQIFMLFVTNRLVESIQWHKMYI